MPNQKTPLVHQKSKIRTLNTHFSTPQYPFSILYLPTQMQMYIVSQKTDFKREFQYF